MTDGDTLYAAILDRRDDDTPRLVYADWLDDNGDADRAAFVRVQVELARTEDCGHAARGTWRLDGSCRTCPKLYPLRERERVLWFGHSREWFGDTALWLPTDNYDRASPHVTGLVVRRGWPDEVRLTLAAFVGEVCDCSDAIQGWGCPTCQNTGHTPGLAPQLAGLPLTRCVLVGREPNPFRDDEWTWSRESNRDDPRHTIPDELFWHLAGYQPDRVENADEDWRDYPTRDDALQALSAACLEYVRSLRPEPCAPAIASDAQGE